MNAIVNVAITALFLATTTTIIAIGEIRHTRRDRRIMQDCMNATIPELRDAPAHDYIIVNPIRQ